MKKQESIDESGGVGMRRTDYDMTIEKYAFYEKLLDDGGNILVAGQAGSGKSVVLNGLILSIMMRGWKMYLLDPKGGMEFGKFEHSLDVAGYGEDIEDFPKVLGQAVDEMMRRHRDGKARHISTYDGDPIYVIIDEFGDMMTEAKKQCLPLLLKIARMGRASRVYLVLATQSPSRAVVTSDIKVNMHATIALHTKSALDSRIIIDQNGAEKLMIGEAMVQHRNAFGVMHEAVPMYPEELVDRAAWMRTPVSHRWERK